MWISISYRLSVSVIENSKLKVSDFDHSAYSKVWNWLWPMSAQEKKQKPKIRITAGGTNFTTSFFVYF